MSLQVKHWFGCIYFKTFACQAITLYTKKISETQMHLMKILLFDDIQISDEYRPIRKMAAI